MQRRFVEVYEQMAANLEETRRYYTKAQILKSPATECLSSKYTSMLTVENFCAVQHADRHAQVLDQGDFDFEFHCD